MHTTNATTPSHDGRGLLRRAAPALAALLLLGGCAGLQQLGKSPEDIVRARAETRWNALIAGDWEKAYSFSTPAYRAATDVAAFTARVRGVASRKGAEVRSVSCAQSTCDAVVRLTFQPVLQRGYGELNTDVDERWVEEDGQWYIYQRQ